MGVRELTSSDKTLAARARSLGKPDFHAWT